MSDKKYDKTIGLRKLNRTILRNNDVDFIMTNKGGKEMTKIEGFKASPLFASIAEKILNIKVNAKQLDAITEVYEPPVQLEEGSKKLGATVKSETVEQEKEETEKAKPAKKAKKTTENSPVEKKTKTEKKAKPAKKKRNEP